jgi:hypothetical protein
MQGKPFPIKPIKSNPIDPDILLLTQPISITPNIHPTQVRLKSAHPCGAARAAAPKDRRFPTAEGAAHSIVATTTKQSRPTPPHVGKLARVSPPVSSPQSHHPIPI